MRDKGTAVEQRKGTLLLILRSCVLCVCSPCSGEGEGLHPAPGQLLIVWQQPVHQPQRQRRVGVRRRLWLELRVGSRGAAQQEEAARGGQLDGRPATFWRKAVRRGAGEGERKRSLQSSQGSSTSPPPPPAMPTTTTTDRPPPQASSLSLLHLWVDSHWRLMTHQTSSHRRHNRLSFHPISKIRREEVGWVEDDCFNPSRELQVFPPLDKPPSHPSLSLFFGSPSLVFPP